MLTESILNDERAVTSMTTLSYLNSSEFYIATSSIFELLEQINTWLVMGVCGAMIYGRARIGKTTAISYIVDALHLRYGDAFPVITWSLTEHALSTKDKTFYANILDALGLDITAYKRVTALELKNKVINYFAIKAAATPFRKIVLMIDEAYKLDYREYFWLMDIYNSLFTKYGIQLTVFLVGTPHEMIDMRNAFKAEKQLQIVERFMLNDFVFHGICNPMQISLCLAELDKATIQPSSSSKCSLAEFYFPDAYKDNHAFFVDLSQDYWDSFEEMKSRYGIKDKDIPMQYFMQSFILCLAIFGAGGIKEQYFLTKEAIVMTIEETGYGKTTENC